ncbi:MAG: ribonuclease P protein component [Candidatus Margulisbacteria bacterium]|nr:ribonuclease P protein component [Candidatus Margulisiibacteriota bacterium]
MRLKTLTAQADFQEIYESGQKQVAKSFVAFFKAGTKFKCAAVASRKTIGIAVKRNRAKRLLRELVRGVKDKPAGSLILVARASLLERNFAGVKKELEQCLKNWQSA